MNREPVNSLDMSSVYLVRGVDGKFSPATLEDERAISSIRPGQMIRCEDRRPINPKFRRKFFRMLGIFFDHQSQFNNKNQLIKWLKIRIGHCEVIVLESGRPVYREKSISTGSITRGEFEAFYDQCVLALLELAPTLNADDLVKEMEILEIE